MRLQMLIAGAGLGGLSAALALQRAGHDASVFEQTPVLSEVGAGIQLGPNATRILSQWSLAAELRKCAAVPRRVVVRSANDGSQLGSLTLGADIEARYGAPYLTIHRADLQSILHHAAVSAGATIVTASHAVAAAEHDEMVELKTVDGTAHEGDALIAADGVWSILRQQVRNDGPAPPTGHVAYRAIAPQLQLPEALRSEDVTVWLGPGVHAVVYPVRAGELLNVVAIVETGKQDLEHEWDREGVTGELQAAAGEIHPGLRSLLDAMPSWRQWPIHDRRPMHGAGEMARGRIALLGDAAHPMRPYLAQGAGMAIEDADELASRLDQSGAYAVPVALAAYAAARWERCARVQATARRNGRIFHSRGLVAFGRDKAMAMLGERLLDQPWLYGHRRAA